MWANLCFDVCLNKNRFSLIFWQILVFSSIFSQVKCHCSFTPVNGFLNCRKTNLTSVPINIPPDTKIIDLSENRIHTLEKNSFNCCSLVTELYLSGNKLNKIHYGAFHNLNNLQILDVSDNLLSNFQVDTPVSLEVLYLDRNPLLNEYIFQQRLQFLKYLSLVGTNITRLPIFSNFLPVLQYLDLRDNLFLSLSTEDLQKLRHLRILYLSSRLFSGRNKVEKCKEFVQETKKLNIGVKSFTCYPEKKFEIKSRSFERQYEVEQPLYDRKEIGVFMENKNDTCIHDLQTLVSDGMKNFIKSLLIEKSEITNTGFKTKDSIKLEDFITNDREIRLYDVFMSGFPVFKAENRPIETIASVDAEEYRNFRVGFTTQESQRHTIITGKFSIEYQSADFSCNFSKTNYGTQRTMLRGYDMLTRATHIQEQFGFEKMDCFTSLSNQYVDKIIEIVLSAMSQNWLNFVSNTANAGVIDPILGNSSRYFANDYRRRVLHEVISHGITYLKNVDINSFDISPSLYLKGQGSDLDTRGTTYNIKIYNLFDYLNYVVQYTTEEQKYGMKIFVKTVITYDKENTAKLAITSKLDPSDIMTIYINNMEFISTFEVKSINKVNRLNIGDTKVVISEKDTKDTFFFTSIVKKYLAIELANEFKRSLKFLTSKIDFYSLNVV